MTVLRLTKPSFGGNAEFVQVGESRYGLPPPGSRIKKVQQRGRELAYVLLYDGELHAFVDRGEVEIPAYLHPIILSAHFSEVASESEQP